MHPSPTFHLIPKFGSPHRRAGAHYISHHRRGPRRLCSQGRHGRGGRRGWRRCGFLLTRSALGDEEWPGGNRKWVGKIVGCSCWKFLCKKPVAIAFWINTWDKCYTKRKVLLLNILVFLRISWRSLGWVLDPTPIKKAQKSSPVQENKLPPPNHQWWHLTYPGMFEDSGNPTTMAGGIIANFCQYLWTAIFIPLAR